MQIGERADDGEPHALGSACVVAHRLGDRIPDDHAAAVFHDEKFRADDAVVLAQEHGPWRGREALPEAGQNPVLPGHVVGARGDPPERRTSQHQRHFAKPQQVGEVCRSVGELQHIEFAIKVRQPVPEESGDARPVQVLAGPDRRDIAKLTGRHGSPPSTLSTAPVV